MLHVQLLSIYMCLVWCLEIYIYVCWAKEAVVVVMVEGIGSDSDQ